MTWLYYAVGTAFFYALLNIFSRVLMIESKNPRAFALAFNIICIIMSIILFIFTGSYKSFSLPVRVEAWMFMIVASFFYGLNERLRFYIAKILEASIYSIVGNISVIVAFVISLFLYKETLTVSKFIGSLLILISIILVSEIKKTKISTKGLGLAILTSIYVGIAMGLDKKGAIYFNAETYNILLWILPFIVLYFPSIKIDEIINQYKIFTWKIVMLAFFNFAAFYFSLRALILADATKVIPVIQLATIFTVIIGIFFLKERNNLLKKILTGVIAVVGVFMLR
jgi:uncharacterized membrane protein